MIVCPMMEQGMLIRKGVGIPCCVPWWSALQAGQERPPGIARRVFWVMQLSTLHEHQPPSQKSERVGQLFTYLICTQS